MEQDVWVKKYKCGNSKGCTTFVPPRMPNSRAIEVRMKGEAETEKGPVDLFPAERTDEAIYREETLNPGFKGPLRLNTKMDRLYADPFCIYAEEGTWKIFLPKKSSK